MSTAPYYADVARGPVGEVCAWIHADDGTRLRACHWSPSSTKGTVLMFPGRTEFVEKYSDAAQELATRGFASAVIDWRGQGLADRVDKARRLGHVWDFAEYQQDVHAFASFAQEQGLPEPYFLLAHSMGGCIGLRALCNGLAVRAAIFSGPMWGFGLPFHMRVGGWILSNLAVPVGFGLRFAPTEAATAEPASQPFKDNLLTSDEAMYEWMQTQVRTHPDLFLGGISLGWLRAAFREMSDLRKQPAPDLPSHTWLGLDEKIVSIEAIRTRLSSWDTGKLIEVAGARHEVIMESPQTRQAFYDQSATLFENSTR